MGMSFTPPACTPLSVLAKYSLLCVLAAVWEFWEQEVMNTTNNKLSDIKK
jgi:hypothetical protein